MFCFVLFKQKTAYEMRISDWSSDVCSSDLVVIPRKAAGKEKEGDVVKKSKKLHVRTELFIDQKLWRQLTEVCSMIMTTVFNTSKGTTRCFEVQDRKSVV